MLRRPRGKWLEKRWGESSEGKLKSELEEECRCRWTLFGGAVESEPAEKVGRSLEAEKGVGCSGFRDMSILSTTEWRVLSVSERSCEILSSGRLSSAWPLALPSLYVSRGVGPCSFDARFVLILFLGVCGV